MRFVSTNDLHSHLTDSTTLFAELYRAKQAGAVVLDIGDFFEGTFFYCQHHGQPERLLLDALYDVVCPGNHGFAHLLHPYNHCRVVCLNIHDHTNSPRFEPFIVLDDVDGQVVLTAIMTPEVFETIPYNERQGLSCASPWEALSSFLDTLKPNQRCVVMSHCGLDEDATHIAAHPLLQAVLSSHCHAPDHMAQREDLTIVKAPEYGRGYVDMSSTRTTLTCEVIEVESEATALPAPLSFLYEWFKRTDAHEVMGAWTAEHARLFPNREALTLALMERWLSTWPGTTALLNVTCMRNLLPEGPVRAEALYALFPFGNRIVQGTMSRLEYKKIFAHIEQLMPGMLMALDAQVDESNQDTVILLTSSHLWENYFLTELDRPAAELALIRDDFQTHFLR